MGDLADLAERLRRHAEHCAESGSPLTAALLYGAANDLPVGGIVATVLAGEEHRPSGSVPALRLAGALHRLVLQGRAPELAAHYPSAGGRLSVDQLWPTAEMTMRRHESELVELVRRPVQTNEVGRSAVLYGALLLVADRYRMPLRLLEIGASAGLNLHADRFAYVISPEETLGDAASTVRLYRPWEGDRPRRGELVIASRNGCDPAPLDPGSADDRLTLMSFVWPDQLDRLGRLHAALDIARRQPVVVEPLPATAFLTRELTARVPGVATVVWQSVVRQYLDAPEVEALDRILHLAGSRATPGAPLAHLTMEPARGGDGQMRFHVRLTLWPDGTTALLADCHGHGPPVRWRSASGR